MPQGIAGVNLFNTFEEEHNIPAIPRYNTRALARQHAAHLSQTRRPRVFHPLAFAPRKTMPTHMANSVINEETGAILEYRHLINDASTFTIWNEAAKNEFGQLAQGVGESINGSKKILFIPRQAVPK
jgi:2-oxoglutarate dehydrogenase complex dehydrogenase (E1) component-like enzyme